MVSLRGRLVSVATAVTMLAGLHVSTMAIPAHASCAAEPEDAIAEQEVVFLATATEQTERHARVEVEEIWRGPALTRSVWLQTSAAEPPPWPASLVFEAATSIDVQLVPGTRYLIATEGDGFRTNTCLVAQASEELVQRLAPETTRQPVPTGERGEGPGILEGTSGIALAVALLAALLVGGWLTYRRFRAAR